MSSATPIEGGPPDWANGNPVRDERTAPPSPADGAADHGAEHGSGGSSAGGADHAAGADSGPTGNGSDKPGTAPPDAAAKAATPDAARPTTPPDAARPATPASATATKPAGETGGSGEPKPAETFWLAPSSQASGGAATASASLPLNSHHVLLGSAGEPGGRLGELATAHESAMWVARAAADETPGDTPAVAPAAAGAAPSASEIGEAVAGLLPGFMVDAGSGLVAVGAGVLDSLAPPQALDGVTRAAGQIAARLTGEPEGGGDGWEAWVVAAGLAAASVELARRQFRRRAARAARAAGYWGVCDVF